MAHEHFLAHTYLFAVLDNESIAYFGKIFRHGVIKRYYTALAEHHPRRHRHRLRAGIHIIKRFAVCFLRACGIAEAAEMLVYLFVVLVYDHTARDRILLAVQFFNIFRKPWKFHHFQILFIFDRIFSTSSRLGGFVPAVRQAALP